MSRFILLNEGADDVAAAVALVDGMSDVRILDRTDDRALLVEASPERMAQLIKSLAGWKIRPETKQARPAPPFPRGKWKL